MANDGLCWHCRKPIDVTAEAWRPLPFDLMVHVTCEQIFEGLYQQSADELLAAGNSTVGRIDPTSFPRLPVEGS